jgi:hypothetical protein
MRENLSSKTEDRNSRYVLALQLAKWKSYRLFSWNLFLILQIQKKIPIQKEGAEGHP